MTSESTSPVKVLVAEDEPAMLSLVGRHMKSLGFSVVEASDGDMAWDLAAKHHPDLVILDVMMPGMSGWEICKRLKSDASEGRPFANTGVIMLTGIGENLNEMTSPLFAADAWLNKPFDFGELDGKVRETLTQYGKTIPSPLSDRDQGNGRSGAPGGAKDRGATSSEPTQKGGATMAKSVADAVVKKAASVVERAAAAVQKAMAPAKKAAKKTTAKKGAAKTSAGAKKTAASGAKKTAGASGAKKTASGAKKTAGGAKKTSSARTGAKKTAGAKKTSAQSGAKKTSAKTGAKKTSAKTGAKKSASKKSASR